MLSRTRPAMGLPLILMMLMAFLQPAVAQRQWVTAVISGKTVSWIWTPLPTGPATTQNVPAPTTTSRVVSRPTPTPSDDPAPVTRTTSSRRTSTQVTSSPTPTVQSDPSSITSTSRDPTADGASQTETPSSSQSSGGSGLSTGAIAGLAVGMSILGIAIIAGIIFFLLTRRKKQKLDSSAASLTEGGAGPEMATTSNFAPFRENWPESTPHREPTLPALGSVTDLPSQTGFTSDPPKVPVVFPRESNDFDPLPRSGPAPVTSNNSPWAPRVARGAQSPIPGSYEKFKVARRPVPGSSPPT